MEDEEKTACQTGRSIGKKERLQENIRPSLLFLEVAVRRYCTHPEKFGSMATAFSALSGEENPEGGETSEDEEWTDIMAAVTQPSTVMSTYAGQPRWSREHTALLEMERLEELLGRAPALSRSQEHALRCLLKTRRMSLLSIREDLTSDRARAAIVETVIDSNEQPRKQTKWYFSDDDSDSSSDDDDKEVNNTRLLMQHQNRLLSLATLDDDDDDDDDDDQEEEDEVDPQISYGQTNLLECAACGDVDGLKASIPPLAALATADCRDGVGRTALMLSAQGGHSSAVTLLLRSGARADVVDDNGFTALHHAACEGDVEVAQALVFPCTSGGMSPHADFLFRGHVPKAQQRGGGPASGDYDTPDPKEKGADCNGTALYWACKFGRVEMVQFFLDRDEFRGRIDEGANEDGDSPLWAAAYHRHEAICHALLSAGADAVSPNSVGLTLLSVMRLRKSDSITLVAAVKEAIASRAERERVRLREEALNESRKRVTGQGEPDAGPGVALVRVALPDKRKSTMKRRFVLDVQCQLLFDVSSSWSYLR